MVRQQRVSCGPGGAPIQRKSQYSKYKFQIKNNNQTSKFQTVGLRPFLELEIWNLFVIWLLEFVIF
jgi:hypothetical protein